MNPDSFYERIQALREAVSTDANSAGIEALRLMEDLFYDEAQARGFRNRHGGLGEYTDYLRRHNYLSVQQQATARRYAEVRNCVSHRSGLLLSPALTSEVLDFLETLIKGSALTAGQLMTRRPRTIAPEDSLLAARDWMVQKNISQLPVLADGKIVGVLTNRDLLLIESRLRQEGQSGDALQVADAMWADAGEQLIFLPPHASYDEVLDALRRHQSALLITPQGDAAGPLLGIITVNDLLPKL